MPKQLSQQVSCTCSVFCCFLSVSFLTQLLLAADADRVLATVQLRNLSQKGSLVKVKASYKLGDALKAKTPAKKVHTAVMSQMVLLSGFGCCFASVVSMHQHGELGTPSRTITLCCCQILPLPDA